MKIENHIHGLRESFSIINEALQKGLKDRQRTIGFHCSVASVDMLELFLHKQNLITIGTQIKHDWMRSDRKIGDKFPFDFKEKKKILSLIKEIELRRDAFCYGKTQTEDDIRKIVLDFNRLKQIFRELGVLDDIEE